MTSAIEVVRQEINEQVRQRATAVLMLTSGDPEVEEPNDLGDLDSFSVVQLILSLEDYYQVSLLEDMPTFEGKTFEDLTEFIIERIDRQEAGAGQAQAAG